MTRSLKSILMFGMIIGMAAMLVCFDFVIYHTIKRTLFNEFDAGLESAARIMSASVEIDQNEIDLEIDTELIPEFAGSRTSAYYELRQNDGTVIKKSPSLGKDDIVWFKTPHQQTFKTFRMNDERKFRAIIMTFVPRGENHNINTNSSNLFLTVAKNINNLLSKLNFLKYLLIFASTGIIFITCAVAAIVVKRGLKPLSAVAEQIDNIREDNLQTRITGENLPKEIVPIKKQLNKLLERLEISFERERIFNANVAHELRTPLAGIRSIIDVTLTREREVNEYHSALSESLSIINDMEDMVAKLLMLTKIESGQMTSNLKSINAAELVEKCWRPFSEKTISTGIIFENNLSKTLTLKADEAGLSMIFSNLLNNAAEYTNHGGRIWVTAQKKDNGIEIIFENTGNQLTQQQVQSIFDYYSRGDKARSNTGVHSGLGLALVKRIVELSGGKIKADIPNGLFSIHIFLPII